ncbi:MAG: alpha/beta hydrolase, partial [Caldilineaceae bacterium]|nr:alpha/beta hydrolase [Caldilineaceae bacterium]
MTLPAMQRIKINGAELAVRDRGLGEPVVFVHGSMGDECVAVLTEPSLATHYRLIDYHRRGWRESAPLETSISIAQQAADCSAVMDHLGVKRAHLVGQSYGGIILLQMALDTPDAVHSLALLEPALPAILFHDQAFGEVMAKATSHYEAGDKASAMETFGQAVVGPAFHTVLDQTLPPGYFERWVADADTFTLYDAPAMQPWSFTQAEAARITQPVLNLRGANTQPYFCKIHETIQIWLPHAEHVILPDATHAMLQTNPSAAAERLADFFVRHP